MSSPDDLRIGVCGLGLIGGSALLALRETGYSVRGCDAWLAPRGWCSDQGIPVDTTVEDTARAVDVLLVCVPPHAAAPTIAAALDADPDVLVLDVASVKSPIVDDLRRRAPEHGDRFLPAHPLTGAERSGHDAARADLLQGAPWAICPPADDPDGDADSLDLLLRVGPALDALDARLIVCTAEDHDRAVAATSHAPHLVAGALAVVAAMPPTGGALAAALSGGALRDATRVATAPEELWLEVLHANAERTAEALEATAERLQTAATTLRQGRQHVAGSNPVSPTEGLHEIWAAGAEARAAVTDARWAPIDWLPLDLPATWAALLKLGAAGTAVRRLRSGPDGRVHGEHTGPARGD